MNKKYENIIVGISENAEVVSIDRLEVRDNNQFSVVFNGHKIECPLDIEDVKYEWIESYIECGDYEWKYNKCEEYDCSPSELIDNLMDDVSIYDIYDSSCIPEYQGELFNDGNEIYLDFSFSTPMNCKYDISEYMNDDIKSIFERVNTIGTEYHLKSIPTNLWNDLQADIDSYLNKKDRFKESVEFIESFAE